MSYKISRFFTKDVGPTYCVLFDDAVRPLNQGVFNAQDLGCNLSESIDKALEDVSYNLSDVNLLPPVQPSKIVCVGRNYKEHAAELGNKMPEEPLLFLKPTSSIIGNRQAIVLPPQSKQVEHEGELGVVIGRTASRLTANDNPLDYVLGYTSLNDVTARDIQRKDVQFTRGKSFDTFCPVGPFIVTSEAGEIDPTKLSVVTRVNEIVKQRGNTSDMAFPVSELIRYISNVMTLYPCDLIATGTPAGVSALSDGDVVEVEIENVCVLQNPVRAFVAT